MHQLAEHLRCSLPPRSLLRRSCRRGCALPRLRAPGVGRHFWCPMLQPKAAAGTSRRSSAGWQDRLDWCGRRSRRSDLADAGRLGGDDRPADGFGARESSCRRTHPAGCPPRTSRRSSRTSLIVILSRLESFQQEVTHVSNVSSPRAHTCHRCGRGRGAQVGDGALGVLLQDAVLQELSGAGYVLLRWSLLPLT